jgi:drug/metabolite transporter (DMT)-like permease
VLFTIGQVLTVLLAFAWLGERATALQMLGIAFVLGGVGTVMWARLRGEMQLSKIDGVAWGLAAVVCMAVSTIIAKEGLAGANSVQAAFIRMLAGTAGIFVFGQATSRMGDSLRFLLDRRFAALFFVSVFVNTFGGFWLSLLAIEKTHVSIANTLNSTEPLFILPIAVVVLKEKITKWVIIGTALALAGVVLMAMH